MLTSSAQVSEWNIQAFNVLDGGALIHRVKWPRKATYGEIVRRYVHYVQEHYGYSGIIFDGYEQGPSIKDHEHQTRLGKTCADIQVGEFMEAHPNQQIFLSNKSNKSQFILLLSQYLEADGQIVHISAGDADTMIVTHVLRYASQGKVVNVVTDDTDILVLLMYHWKEAMADVYFLSEVKKKISKL